VSLFPFFPGVDIFADYISGSIRRLSSSCSAAETRTELATAGNSLGGDVGRDGGGMGCRGKAGMYDSWTRHSRQTEIAEERGIRPGFAWQ